MTIPALPAGCLEPCAGDDLSAPALLGFRADCWVRAYRQLGPVFHVPELGRIVITGPEASLEAWRRPDDWSYASTSLGAMFRAELGEDYITASDGPVHRRQRKVLRPLFAADALTRYADTVAAGFAEDLATLAAGDADLHDALVLLYTRILNRTLVNSGADDTWVRRFARFEEEMIRGGMLAGAARAAWYGRPGYVALRSKVMDYFRAVVARRLDGARGGDSLDLLVNALTADGARADGAELLRAAYLMQAGGAGNIASLLCNMLWALLREPRWLRAVRDELGRTPAQQLGRGIRELGPTAAVLREAERRYPPTVAMPKAAARDLTFLGIPLAAGTEVLHLFGLVHYLEERYPNPQAFDPERWISGGAKAAHAFGGGAHMCIGMHVARLFLLLTLKELLTGYDVDADRAPYLTPVQAGHPESPLRAAFDVRLSARAVPA